MLTTFLYLCFHSFCVYRWLHVSHAYFKTLYNEVDVFVCIVCASLEFIYKLVTRNYAGSKLYPVAQIKGLFSYGLYFLESTGFEVTAHRHSALL